MQTHTLTIQMSSQPRKILNTNSITLFVKILNAAHGASYYYMKAIAWGDSGRNIINLYNKGDYMIVENYIIYKRASHANILVITREHPIFLSN
uniref:Single-stranded DNA binding protein n=1 Tax=Liagora brachyclada TaxID=1884665 RepID=A0A1G4NZT2_9FLOR|nr:Hypothetical protein ycf41 [Liagora brachyclada]SCW24191.1 Hypothetical protein ycf41 [Liagora brachyclada]